jgi:nucleoside-diphosphate-sugar epimerase
MPLREAFARIAHAAGRRRPWIRVPYAAVRAGAALGMVNRNEALLAGLPEYFSSAKAHRELGYEPSPVDEALRRAVAELR